MTHSRCHFPGVIVHIKNSASSLESQVSSLIDQINRCGVRSSRRGTDQARGNGQTRVPAIHWCFYSCPTLFQIQSPGKEFDWLKLGSIPSSAGGRWVTSILQSCPNCTQQEIHNFPKEINMLIEMSSQNWHTSIFR